MLRWALIFLVVALIAGALGFGGIAGTSMGIAQILFFVFVVLFVVSDWRTGLYSLLSLSLAVPLYALGRKRQHG